LTKLSEAGSRLKEMVSHYCDASGPVIRPVRSAWGKGQTLRQCDPSWVATLSRTPLCGCSRCDRPPRPQHKRGPGLDELFVDLEPTPGVGRRLGVWLKPQILRYPTVLANSALSIKGVLKILFSHV